MFNHNQIHLHLESYKVCEEHILPERTLKMNFTEVLALHSCSPPVHTHPVVRLKWAKVLLDLYAHSTFHTMPSKMCPRVCGKDQTSRWIVWLLG
jgi:hypothetical protein